MSATAVDGSIAASAPRTDEQRQALDRLFARIGEVSSLPAAAVRIVNIANDESRGAKDLISAVETDPSLAVRVLRTVNSTFYSIRNRVGDLKTAVSLLGMKEVRNLALTVHVSRMFAAPGDYRTYRREGLWRHLVAVASTSRLIAEVSETVPRDDAYVAGLLHDVGLILLDQHLRRQFKSILDGLERYPSTIAAERAVLPFDHCELGASVARRWNLSASIAAAAGYHHAPSRYDGPHRNMVSLVCLANYLCTRSEVSSLGVHNVAPPGDDVYRELGIHADRMAQIAARLNETLEAAAAAAAI
ncbi:MAG TPA: HDOD domain-containing protein [Pirellulales bacterium]|nr:HDOD domain-containing protein [Pirellulales bacterium]